MGALGLTMTLCISVSCAPTTGTKATLTSAQLSTIKKAAILVESGTPFSVRIARDRMTNTGALLFGLVGAGVEAGYKASKDAAYEAELTPFMQGFDVIQDSSMAFQENFSSAKLFPMSEIVRAEDGLEERGFDALFAETIEAWGCVFVWGWKMCRWYLTSTPSLFCCRTI